MSQFFKKNFLSLAGIGSNKKAPGTLASFLALVFIVIFKNFFYVNSVLIFLTVIFLIAVIYYLSYLYIGDLIKTGEYDQQWIVIDEFMGMLIAGLPFLIVKPFSGWLLIGGFILFRLLDIGKPWLIKKADLLNSPHGVLLDDVIAGSLTALVLVVAIFIF